MVAACLVHLAREYNLGRLLEFEPARSRATAQRKFPGWVTPVAEALSWPDPLPEDADGAPFVRAACAMQRYAISFSVVPPDDAEEEIRTLAAVGEGVIAAWRTDLTPAP